ncbi:MULTISPECIES: hypothetical protein [Dyella]|uniref:P-type conjugative transfer protein TrbJ n=2 Tax=Dyella TaxID=231454 RepID=A0A4V2NL93_9GAMM|nr:MULTISPECIES: hypothetical protein [Dyella]TBR36915.1 hypothetical protein EYV96_13525 [Dyella terrae]TCI07994.1 hypothetical protein EZM97_25345 [Dyella soli]
MKTHVSKRRVLGIVASGAMAMSTGAVAGIPVVDAANLAVNTIQSVELAVISWQLAEGDMNHMTQHIDNSTTHIDRSTDVSMQYDIRNYEITKNYDWKIIIGGGGGGVTPIPDSKGNNYDSGYYNGKISDRELMSAADLEGSQARKSANDLLVDAMKSQQGQLSHDADLVTQLVDNSTIAQGQGHQLQYANAIAGEQAHQLIQMRSLMLAQANAQNAAAQAQADREAREIAVGQSLRRTSITRSGAAGAD